jgi:hypothetical protein
VTQPDEELPPTGAIDAAIDTFGEQHPELPLPHHSVEPPHELTPVQRFDDLVDGWFDKIRGTEPADRLLYGLTELGDFGLVWLMLAFTRGLRSDADAMLAAMLLTQRSSRPTKVAIFGLGGLVAASRVHVRIHHASDVVGGLAVGLALGAVARRVFPLHRR